MLRSILDNKVALIGFFSIIGLGIVAWVVSGNLHSEFDAENVYRGLKQSGLYLGGATATSSATILALILTMVGLLYRLDEEFDESFYKTILLIAVSSTVCLVTSVVFLMLLTFPVGNYENISSGSIRRFYNVLFGLVVVVSALSVAIVLMLTRTVRRVIAKVAKFYSK